MKIVKSLAKNKVKLFSIGVLSFTLASNAWALTKSEYDKLEEKIWSSSVTGAVQLEQKVARLIQEDAHDVKAFYFLSMINLTLSTDDNQNIIARKEMAMEFAQHAIELEPKNELGFIALSNVLVSTGDSYGAYYILGVSSEGEGDGPAFIPANPELYGVVLDKNTMMNQGSLSWRKSLMLAKIHQGFGSFAESMNIVLRTLNKPGVDIKIVNQHILSATEKNIENSEEKVSLVKLYAYEEKRSSLNEALSALYKISLKYPSNELCSAMALTASKLDRHTEALAAYEKILKNDPKNTKALLLSAMILTEKLGRHHEAIKNFDKYLRLLSNEEPNSDFIMANFASASANIKIKKFKSAEKNFEAVRSITVNTPEANQMFVGVIVATYKESGNEKELSSYLNKLKKEFGDEKIYSELGAYYQKNSLQSKLAIEAFENAIALNPLNYESYSSLSKLQFETGNLDKAEYSASKALALNPLDTKARNIMEMIDAFKKRDAR